MKRQYYYQVLGWNKYVPISHYVKAESMADAKIAFYCETNGTDIKYIIRITKQQFKN